VNAGSDREPDRTDEPAHTAEARRDIERTRAEMSETIEAIQERLSPTNLKEQVMEQVREQVQEAKDAVREATIGKVENIMQSAGDKVYEARRTVVDTIKDNPIPAALAGIGLGWLAMNMWSGAPNGAARTRGRVRGQYVGGQRYYGSGRMPYPNQRVSGGPSFAEETQGALSRTADRAASAAGDAVDTVRETTAYYADQVQRQAEQAGEFVQETWQENPLTVAAVALAVGAAVGFALPQTRKENELMGEARDSLVEKAQGIAGDAMQQVRSAADQLADKAEQATQPPPAPQPEHRPEPETDPIYKGV
jgi:hypothetical protein